MTSEAKIGLLLGLVFIFIIAFIINGLPSFWNKSDSGELTVATETAEDNAVGIGTNERKAGEAIERIEPATAANTGQATQTTGNSDVRFVAELPKTGANASGTAELKPVTVAQALPPETSQQATETLSPAPAEQQTYTVSSGDSLYTIAKKFYGAAEAGKKSTTSLIFNANRNVLKSPSKLQIGQKLVIPPMPNKQNHTSAVESTVITTPTAPTTQVTQDTISQQPVVTENTTTTTQTRDYVVKSGDSLWKIAAKQLGNGSRHDEIAELNSDALKSDDSLTVGMHLKLPAK